MEHETFWTLLRDPAHWMFELFLMLVFDVIIGAILWPRIKAHIHADIWRGVPEDAYPDPKPESIDDLTRRAFERWNRIMDRWEMSLPGEYRE